MNTAADLITDLLGRWRRVDARLLDRALSDAEEELQFIASELLVDSRDSRHPTTAVFLAHSSSPDGRKAGYLKTEDRSRFFEVAVQSLRHSLVRRARKHRPMRAERPHPEQLEQVSLASKILAVHQSIEVLKEIQPRRAKLLELLYFGRLTLQEAAETLGVSTGSLQRDRRIALRWLYGRLAAT